MRRFWLWLCRFAYRRLRLAVAYKDLPDGVPGVRSVSDPCDSYAPRAPQPADFRDCMTDGHYLCRQCALRSPAADRDLGVQDWIQVFMARGRS